MVWIDSYLRQTVTYWAFVSSNTYGKKTFDDPVTASVRWEDVQKEFLNREGQEVVAQSMLLTRTAMAEGGYVYLGTSTETDPLSVDGAERISRVEAVPDITNEWILYHVYI